ncbi:MAG TPA: PH domain-containing protein [Chiayiivirga sp.]|nr:PH domain-containing protein [Chiayiivirga sp.]
MPAERDPMPAARDADASLARLGAGDERRLHPFSWAFVLLAQLRSFALPLIVLLFVGGENDTLQWWGLVAVAAMTIAALLRYFTWRFRIDADELVIATGVLQRTVRHVPLARIQAVSLKRNLLHRAFDVAEVQLESSAAGNEPEARLQVLSMDDARALEQLVELHRHGAGSATTVHDSHLESMPRSPATSAATVLLRVPLSELLKLGIVSDRGTLLFLAAMGSAFNLVEESIQDHAESWAQSMSHFLGGMHLSWLVWLALAGVVLIAAWVLGRVINIVLVLLRDYDFTLERSNERVSVERGLITRVRASVPLSRIQHWSLRQGLLMRWLDRRSVSVETTTLRSDGKDAALSALVPIAAPAALDDIVRQCEPDWREPLVFQAVHPRAWRRLAVPPCVLTLLLCAVSLLGFGLPSLLLVLLLPVWIFVARKQAATAGFVLTETLLIWRSGWLDRRLSFARIDKLQGLRLLQSPFDRRHGMARLHADTAGANPLGHRLHLWHLPEAEARALFDTLSVRVASSQWRC